MKGNYKMKRKCLILLVVVAFAAVLPQSKADVSLSSADNGSKAVNASSLGQEPKMDMVMDPFVGLRGGRIMAHPQGMPNGGGDPRLCSLHCGRSSRLPREYCA